MKRIATWLDVIAGLFPGRGGSLRTLPPGLALLAWLFSIPTAHAATYAERLGWKPDDVVVIAHVDDVGMSHSSNLGMIESLEKGIATSFSVMMPCPWVVEVLRYVRRNPEVDCGLHLTLTSEWEVYRWGPVAGKPAVPGLVDEHGCLWRDVRSVAANATPDEVETEIRAQIERAERMGLPITHLDSHMGALFARRDYFERFLKVGLEKKIPILAIGGHMTHASVENPISVAELRPFAEQIWKLGLPVLDDLHTASYGWPAAEKPARLAKLLEELKPGVTEILFHSSIPTDDFPVITSSSQSRHADTLALTSPLVREVVQRRGIILTTWREVMERRQKARD